MSWAQKRGYGRGGALRILIPIAAVLCGFLLRKGLEHQCHIVLPTYLTFYPPVMLVALFLGFWPGLLATAAAALLTVYWVLPPIGSLKIESLSDVVALGMFVGICTLMSFISDRARRKQQMVLHLEKEKAQQESQEQLHHFIRHALTPMAMFDNEMRYLAVSQRWLEPYQQHEAEMIGRTPYEIFPEVPGHWKDLHLRGLAGETIQCDEDRVERPDGSVHWTRWEVQPWRKRDGEVGGVVIFYEEITDRKQAADALRVSESRYRTAFQTSLDGIALTRVSDGLYLDVNQSFTSILGYEAGDVIGRTSLELHIWADNHDREKTVEALRRDGICRNIEAQLRRKDGTVFWSMVSISMIELNGEACMLSMLRDISNAKNAESALRASENRYRTAFKTSLDGITLTRMRDGFYIDVNLAFTAIFGYEPQDVIGRTTVDLHIWEDDHDRQKMVELLRRDGACRNFEVRLRRKDGSIFWSMASISTVELNGETCMLSVVRDITDAKHAEFTLRASENRYRTAFQTSQDAIVITRLRDGMYIDVNQEFVNVVGYQRDEAVGRTSYELDSWPIRADREKVVETLRRTGVCRNIQTQYRRKSGEIFWATLSSSAIHLDGELCGLTVIRDMSEAKLAEEEIRTLAFFDPLTGLPNRRLLLERVSKSLAALNSKHRRSALLLVDLDQFKILNDTLGHETGDLMLQEVARRLKACVRETDTVCRFGGDEFAVWLESLSDVQETSAGQAKEVAEKVLAAIGQAYQLDGHQCRSTCSIGITLVADSHFSANEILQQSDIAMYHAKGAGRNTVRFFAPALQIAVNTRAAMEEDLRHAIKHNEFLLYYQPQIEAGRLVGAEALLRWKHPRLGIIGPADFILLAEETHLIVPIGDWVLDTACRQAAQWAGNAETAEITVAVNISALQFRKDDFVSTVLSALERNGTNPDRIKLELTETMLVDNMEDLIEKMTELKGHRLRFSVDDFGTGYSSLNYLKRLPLDQLKIDRSFVRDILVDAGSGAIAKTIISLGEAMSLSVIAEGVETEEQREFLAGLGCNAYQGYLFGRPVPVSEFERVVERFSHTVPVPGD